MANSAIVSPKRVSEHFRDFPRVPIRHRKILDKLARCSVCDRLCCCIEHCLTHERKHSEAERERNGSGATKIHDWMEATEATLSSRIVKSEFPFLCVYCSIKVQDESALRHLMSHGPWCSVKKCHWMVPMALYHEVNKENETREVHMDVTQARGACNFPRLTPRKTPERSLLRTALSNCLQQSAAAAAALALRGPLLTSTPEDDHATPSPSPSTAAVAAAAAAPATTPPSPLSPAPYQQTPKATPLSKMAAAAPTPLPQPTGILSCSPRSSKLRRTRKVTFSCDHEIGKLKSGDDDDGDDGHDPAGGEGGRQRQGRENEKENEKEEGDKRR